MKSEIKGFINNIAKLPNDIIWICNSFYQQFPILIKWSIAIGFLIIISQLNVKP